MKKTAFDQLLTLPKKLTHKQEVKYLKDMLKFAENEIEEWVQFTFKVSERLEKLEN